MTQQESSSPEEKLIFGEDNYNNLETHKNRRAKSPSNQSETNKDHEWFLLTVIVPRGN